jgi:PKD repeat protein
MTEMRCRQVARSWITIACAALAVACDDFQDLPWPHRNERPLVTLVKADRDPASNGDQVTYTFEGTGWDDSKLKTFVWDFGDGTVEEDNACERKQRGDGRTFARTDAHVCSVQRAHSYRLGAASTLIVVKLVARDDEGEESAAAIQPVRVRQNSRPAAAFTYSKRTAPDGSFLVAFDAGSSVDPDPEDTEQLEYEWTFGDGDRKDASRDSKTIKHIYGRAGTYKVTLTVSDILKSSDTNYDWVVLP